MPITRAQSAEMHTAAKTLASLKYSVFRNTKAAISQRPLRNSIVDRALLRKDAAFERNTKAAISQRPLRNSIVDRALLRKDAAFERNTKARPVRKAAVVARGLIKLCASSDNECDIE